MPGSDSPDHALARALSVQARAAAELERARRANYAGAADPSVHRRLTAAQAIVLRGQAALYPLARR